jgi:PhnB protein
MPDKVKPIPEGFHTLTPHITVRDAAGAIEFYKKALNAQVINRSDMPNGKVMHASLKIGDSILMLNDEFPEFGGSLAPRGDAPGFAIHVYVENVDKLFAQAVAAGATAKMPLMDQFWGDRYGHIVDPYGFRWALATHVRDVSAEEMKRAEADMAKQMPRKKTA